MRTLLLVVTLSSASALAWGPTVTAGPTATVTTLGSSPTVYAGPMLRFGLEFGTIFNHELSVEYLQLPRFDEPGHANALGLRYAFSVDFLGKRGFTPTVGLGVSGGRFFVTSLTERAGGWAVSAFATVGVRYTFDFGLSLKAELQGGMYGPGIWSAAPTLTAAWRF
jgi:hypothetical protein